MCFLPWNSGAGRAVCEAHVSGGTAALEEACTGQRRRRERRRTGRDVLEGGERNSPDGHAGVQPRPQRYADVAGESAIEECRPATAGPGGEDPDAEVVSSIAAYKTLPLQIG